MGLDSPSVEHIYLRTARERAELTQSALAAKAGVDQKTISRLELDREAQPAFNTQTKIAHALGVDPASLLFGPDPNAPSQAVAS